VAAPAGATKTSEARRFVARWTRKLFSLPSDGRQVISLLGEAKAQVTGMGRLDADEIHAWLIEQPAAATAGDASQKPKFDLLPDRMMALSGGKDAKVVIDSPQLTGRTDKLEMFVHPAAPRPKNEPGPAGAGEAATNAASREAAGRGPAGPTGLAGSSLPGSERSASQASQRFDINGQRIQVQLAQIGRTTEWRQVDIFGGARLVETQTAKPGDRPFAVTGDFVHATQAEADAAQVTVTGKLGKPAHIEGRSLSLTGEAINLNQQTNRVEIDGPGMMTLVTDRDLQGDKLSQPTPVEITWQGSMQFDGKQAVFDRDALVKQQQATLRTQTLTAVLSQPIDLAHPKQGGGNQADRPQIGRVLCRGGLLLDRQTSDERGPLAHERLQAADLTIDELSGAIFGNGPGWLTRVSRRDGDPVGQGGGAGLGPRPAGPLSPAAKGAARSSLPAVAPAGAGAGASPFMPAADPDKPLDYLRVDFQTALRGNLHQRVIAFSDQVQTIHAPVRTWDDTVNPDRIELLGPRGAVLKCDELQLTELRGPGGAKWFEASAKGNANVEGETFTAQAARLDYAQDKDLLILEGTDRTPAELWRQQGVGMPRSHLAARRIEFWRRDNHIKIDKAQYLDVDDIPGNKERSRPKPSGVPRPR